MLLMSRPPPSLPGESVRSCPAGARMVPSSVVPLTYQMTVSCPRRRLPGSATICQSRALRSSDENNKSQQPPSCNDVPVLLSTTKAERVNGGYRVTGRKHFISPTPLWTRLGLHVMDTT